MSGIFDLFFRRSVATVPVSVMPPEPEPAPASRMVTVSPLDTLSEIGPHESPTFTRFPVGIMATATSGYTPGYAPSDEAHVGRFRVEDALRLAKARLAAGSMIDPMWFHPPMLEVDHPNGYPNGRIVTPGAWDHKADE